MSRARDLADLGNNAGGLETLTVSDITDITATATELNYVNGVNSAIQTQLNAKLATSTASSTYAPLASPDFTGTVDLTGTTISLDDNQISGDAIEGGTIGVITIFSLFGQSFTFSGGGTQTVFTIPSSTEYIVISAPRNYSGTDDRHGDVAYVSSPRSGVASIGTVYGGSGSGSFTLSGASVQYSAGGGNPATNIYYMRVA